jgi:hypothetical protein
MDLQQLQLNKFNNFLTVVGKIFEKDGHLLEEHRSRVNQFASELQSNYIHPRTPEETAAGLKKIENFIIGGCWVLVRRP